MVGERKYRSESENEEEADLTMKLTFEVEVGKEREEGAKKAEQYIEREGKREGGWFAFSISRRAAPLLVQNIIL